MKRMSLLLCMLLTITMAAGLPAAVYAAEDDLTVNLNAVKGAYITHSQERNEMVYDEDVFRTSSYDYNTHLATMSIDLCELGAKAGRYTDKSEEYLLQSRNLCEYLEANGFTEIETNDDYKQEAASDSVCFACAHKILKVGSREYTLLVLVPRGGTYDAEWPQNFTISDSRADKGDLAGYRKCCDKMEAFAKEYICDKEISGDVKVWTAGYSRGAGIVNIFGGDLIDRTSEVLGNDVTLDPEDLYCYTFGTMRSAATSDGSADRYKGIHNVFETDDIASNIIPSAFGLSRYGQNHTFSEISDLNRMLALLKDRSSYVYSRFQSGNSANPYEYSPYKLDTDALMDGSLGVVKDDDSYLPDNLSDYLQMESESIGVFSARSSDSGTDSREGFYDYQTAANNLLTYTRIYDNEGELISGITSSEKAIPLMLSVYLTFVIDKAVDDSNASINDAVEDCFNTLAYIMEDDNGDLKTDFCCIGRYGYNKLKSLLFTENTELTADETAAATIMDPPQKYRLRVNVHGTTIALRLMKKITGKLYAEALEETLESLNADEDTVELLTDETDCENIAYALTYMALGNNRQSKGVPEFSLDNEQFKQLATFLGNLSRMSTTHDIDAVVSWLRAADSYHDSYSTPDDAEFAGYRRVYIGQPEGVNVSGIVKDDAGNDVAEFKNGALTSRTDEWIGYTTSDNGGWLRLPLDQSYTVKLSSDSDTTLDISVAEYSLSTGGVVRTIDSDSIRSWSNISAKAGMAVTLGIPEISETDGAYVLPSAAAYTLDVPEEEVTPSSTSASSETYSASLPKIRSVKAKASKKAFTVKWKKLSAKQRKAVSKIEVQYSTDKTFASASTVTKKVSAKKNSLKVKKLKKGSTYYVRICSIKNNNGTKRVSNWSAVKKVKVK